MFDLDQMVSLNGDTSRVPPVRVRPDPVDPPQGGRPQARSRTRSWSWPRPSGRWACTWTSSRDAGRGRRGRTSRTSWPRTSTSWPSLYTTFYDQCPVLKAETPDAGREPPVPVRPDGPHPPPGHGPAGHPHARAALTARRNRGPSSPPEEDGPRRSAGSAVGVPEVPERGLGLRSGHPVDVKVVVADAEFRYLCSAVTVLGPTIPSMVSS